MVSVICSDIMSDQNVKLAGHIQNLVGQCPDNARTMPFIFFDFYTIVRYGLID